jgi:L-alanine-DL-glutamate epimerase-like enolase superfamily enzyme
VRAFYRTWYLDLVTGLPEVSDGQISVGRRPGHGVELHPDLAKRFTLESRTTALK